MYFSLVLFSGILNFIAASPDLTSVNTDDDEVSGDVIVDESAGDTNGKYHILIQFNALGYRMFNILT